MTHRELYMPEADYNLPYGVTHGDDYFHPEDEACFSCRNNDGQRCLVFGFFVNETTRQRCERWEC